jgi:polyhydroxybutyrate depolymerase
VSARNETRERSSDRRNRRVTIWIASFVITLVGLAAQPPDDLPQPGTTKRKMEIRAAGFRRTYLLHVPEGYDGTARPLVVVIHGAFSGAKEMEERSGFSRLADREGFITVYPNGIGFFGLLRHWNSGHCCGKARKDDIDDVGFIEAVIDEVAAGLEVDRERVYLVGHSNGGMLAYRIAAEKPDLVAAVAPVAATIGGKPSGKEPEWVIPEPLAPVPMIVVHGDADENVPYDGGTGGQTKGKMISIPVRRSIEFWVRANGCESDPAVEQVDSGGVTRETWAGCARASSVELLSLDGWGHDWPGPYFTTKLPEDSPLHGFDAAELIWEFLRQHRRDR